VIAAFAERGLHASRAEDGDTALAAAEPALIGRAA
jgi:hypothetical protein